MEAVFFDTRIPLAFREMKISQKSGNFYHGASKNMALHRVSISVL